MLLLLFSEPPVADVTVQPTGNAAAVSLGSVSVTIGATVSVTGFGLITYLGVVDTGWGPVDQSQTPSWSTISQSQTPSWSVIDQTQSGSWTDVRDL